MYPINIKATPEFIEQLIECETGRQEDNPNQTTFCDFGDRHNDTIECRNDTELTELYLSCATSTIGVMGYAIEANRIIKRIRDAVMDIDPTLVLTYRS